MKRGDPRRNGRYHDPEGFGKCRCDQAGEGGHAMKTFRITEWGEKGQVLVREVKAESFDQIERGWRLISVELLDRYGKTVAAIWMGKRSGEERE